MLSVAAKQHQRETGPAEWLSALEAISGPHFVTTRFVDRLAYSRDRTPIATFGFRSGQVPRSVPRAIVQPADEAEVVATVRLARREGLSLIPYGAGSGVVGGALPLGDEVMVDLKRLDGIGEIDETNGLVTVEAGMNGGRFEEALNAAGWTSGHYPQSMYMSTVGGWAACRGAGQASSRYGKIEDIVVGLRAVMPDGETMEVRPLPRRAVGPGLRDLLVGSEGTLGIITQLTLRIWRRPEARIPCVLAFPSLDAAWNALREIMQAELRPETARLYDAIESHERTGDGAPFADNPFLCILVFAGHPELAAVERKLALAICERHGARVSDDLAPYEKWEAARYQSYSPRHQARRCFMDTIEITGNWSAIPGLYAGMSEAVRDLHPDVFFGTHWSHVYAEGACQYMTIRFPALEEAEGLRLHQEAWRRVQSLCIEKGGSISHHHGAGSFRNPWLPDELGHGHVVLQAIKDALDPSNVCNPGKLALRAAEAEAAR